MSKTLLIVFVKNIKPGKVKTRLAKTIGDEAALDIYKQLLTITEQATEGVLTDKRVCFSESIIKEKWLKSSKFVQKGVDLGEKMENSFEKAFKDGYERIVLIGSDLPDMSAKIINKAFDELLIKEVVFGKAEDGGYYLVGLSKKHFTVFKNKPWSMPNLLKVTLEELDDKNISFSLLETMNDIDTFEDLKKSKLYNNA